MLRRDAFLLLVASIIILISLLYESSFHFVRHEVLFEGDDLKQSANSQPCSTFIDLDKDGREAPAVIVYSLSGEGGSTSLVRKARASLASNLRVAASRLPVALSGGMLSRCHPLSQAPECAIMVAVVLDGGGVLLLDNELRVRWEAALPLDDGEQVVDAAVNVAPINVFAEDRGVVIVSVHTIVKDVNGHGKPGTRPEPNIYALDGKTGELRWSQTHDAHEASKGMMDPASSLPQHSVAGLEEGALSGDWRRYSFDVLRLLPARNTPRLMSGVLHVAPRPRQPNTPQLNQHTASAILHSQRHMAMLMDRERPNAVAVLSRMGLHLFHLYTGRVLATAPLQLRRAAVGDINGDGVVERVELAYTQGGSHPQMCRMRVSAGIPPRGALFDIDVCRAAPGGLLRRLWGPGNAAGGDGHGHELHDQRVEAAGPVLLRRDTGDLAHDEEYDALVWFNSGRVASVSPTGALNWALETPARWQSGGTGVERDHVLVTGERDAALVSAAGNLLTSVSLPSPSLSAPALGDADGDTWSDVALVHADRVTLLLSRRRTTTPLAVLVACAVVAVALAVWSFNKATLQPAMRDVALRVVAAMRGSASKS